MADLNITANGSNADQNPSTMAGWWHGLDRWQRTTLLVWTAILVTLCGRGLLWPRIHSVYPIYAEAARNWREGEELYYPYRPHNELDTYRYSPLVAALLVPFSMLPDHVGGMLWRLLNAAIYLAGLAWFCRAALPRSLTRSQRAILFLLAAPLAGSSLNNGQCNPLVIGLLLLAAAGAGDNRWTLASLCVALACMFKLYPVAMGLLLAAVFPRRFVGRLLLALLAGLALPFLLGPPDFVWRQYVHWIELVQSDDRSAWELAYGYRDMWMLFRMLHVPMAHQAYVALQCFTGTGVAGLCLEGRWRGWPHRQLLTAILTLGTCWMTLFGPATESCTYTLLGPTLAWALVDAAADDLLLGPGIVLLIAAGLFLFNQISCWFPHGLHLRNLGLQPLGGLLLFAHLLIGYVRGLFQWRPVGPARPQAAALSG